MLGDGSGPLFEPGSGRGQVSAATQDGTGQSPGFTSKSRADR